MGTPYQVLHQIWLQGNVCHAGVQLLQMFGFSHIIQQPIHTQTHYSKLYWQEFLPPEVYKENVKIMSNRVCIYRKQKVFLKMGMKRILQENI